MHPMRTWHVSMGPILSSRGSVMSLTCPAISSVVFSRKSRKGLVLVLIMESLAVRQHTLSHTYAVGI